MNEMMDLMVWPKIYSALLFVGIYLFLRIVDFHDGDVVKKGEEMRPQNQSFEFLRFGGLFDP
jgi:hypothetical protein